MLTDGILRKLSDYGRSKLNQLRSLFAKGLGPQQANHVVKETSSINPFQRKGVQPHEALAIWRDFKTRKEESLASMPTMRSQRLYKSMATQTDFSSSMDHRYLIDFEFKVKNSVTGNIETVFNTLGFRRLERWGKIQDAMQKRVLDMIAISEEEQESIYTPLGSEYIDNTIKVTGFFRTLNN